MKDRKDTKDELLQNNEENFKMSKNQLITKKYKKIHIKYNFRANDHLRDYLYLNKSKKS